MLKCGNNTLISIIIPTYNYASFLSEAIKSTKNQSGVSTEIIVVDDGSIDNTQQVLEGFFGRDNKRIHVLHQYNQGLSAARNTGLKIASGDFVVFLDADDILLPNVLSSQSEILYKNLDIDIVVCRNFLFEHLDENNKPIPCGEWRLFLRNLDIHLCHFNIAPIHAFMVRRSVIEEIGGFDIRLRACEDHDLWFRAMANNARIESNPKSKVAYRRHEASLSSDSDRQWWHDAIMHERIGLQLNEDGRIPKGGRSEGLVGHIAGCLLTANRLKDHPASLSEKLRLLVESSTKNLIHESPHHISCPKTLEYLLNRIYMLLWEPIKKGETWACELRTQLQVCFDKICPSPDLHYDVYRREAELLSRCLTVV